MTTKRTTAFALALAISGGTAAASAPTTLSLTVTGQARSAPDAMIAHLTIQSTDPTSATAQAAVNRTMKSSLAAARAITGLRATTGAYSVFAANTKQTAWHAQQNLTLRFDAPPDAKAANAVRHLIGQYQSQGIALQNLSGTLRQSSARAARTAAIADAITQLRAEAQAVATPLHDRIGPIVTLHLDTPTPFRPMIRARMLTMAPSPQAQSAPITVQVTLSATIQLQPRAHRPAAPPDRSPP